jgi:hypothetical protein
MPSKIRPIYAIQKMRRQIYIHNVIQVNGKMTENADHACKMTEENLVRKSFNWRELLEGCHCHRIALL